MEATIYNKDKDQRLAAFEDAWKERWEDSKSGYFQTKPEESPFSNYSSKGWKIHIAFEKGKEKDMAQFLFSSGLYFKLEGRIGTYFNGNKASGATIYIGSYDNMTAIAEHIEQNLSQSLVDGAPMNVGGKMINVGSGSDIEVRPKITARFDVAKTPFGWYSGNGKYAEDGIGAWFGLGGITILATRSKELRTIEGEWNTYTQGQRTTALAKLKEIYEESKTELIKDFGEEFVFGFQQ